MCDIHAKTNLYFSDLVLLTKGKFFMVDDNIVSGPSSSVLPIGREIERNSEEILKIIYIITKSFL